jgi:hypothetical protein
MSGTSCDRCHARKSCSVQPCVCTTRAADQSCSIRKWNLALWAACYHLFFCFNNSTGCSVVGKGEHLGLKPSHPTPSPTTCRIARLTERRSATFVSSYPASRGCCVFFPHPGGANRAVLAVGLLSEHTDNYSSAAGCQLREKGQTVRRRRATATIGGIVLIVLTHADSRPCVWDSKLRQVNRRPLMGNRRCPYVSIRR